MFCGTVGTVRRRFRGCLGAAVIEFCSLDGMLPFIMPHSIRLCVAVGRLMSEVGGSTVDTIVCSDVDLYSVVLHCVVYEVHSVDRVVSGDAVETIGASVGGTFMCAKRSYASVVYVSVVGFGANLSGDEISVVSGDPRICFRSEVIFRMNVLWLLTVVLILRGRLLLRCLGWVVLLSLIVNRGRFGRVRGRM